MQGIIWYEPSLTWWRSRRPEHKCASWRERSRCEYEGPPWVYTTNIIVRCHFVCYCSRLKSANSARVVHDVLRCSGKIILNIWLIIVYIDDEVDPQVISLSNFVLPHCTLFCLYSSLLEPCDTDITISYAHCLYSRICFIGINRRRQCIGGSR